MFKQEWLLKMVKTAGLFKFQSSTEMKLIDFISFLQDYDLYLGFGHSFNLPMPSQYSPDAYNTLEQLSRSPHNEIPSWVLFPALKSMSMQCSSRLPDFFLMFVGTDPLSMSTLFKDYAKKYGI